MENKNINWTKEDLKTYLLIYCANADFSESKIEIEFIKAKIQTTDFDKIHREFEQDNDNECIQKIQASIKELNYKKDEIDSLINEIKELFLSDGEYDILEKNIFRGLKHIVK